MNNDVEVRAEKVMKYVRSLRENRGAMADLRCALTDTRRHRAWPWLAAVGGIENPAIEAVAGLYAYHPDESTRDNMGATCRKLSGEHNSFDGRFRRLLACDRADICEHLRPVVLAAKAKGIPVNYEMLLVDLTVWGERVKARWAKQYWGVTEDAASAMEAKA